MNITIYTFLCGFNVGYLINFVEFLINYYYYKHFFNVHYFAVNVPISTQSSLNQTFRCSSVLFTDVLLYILKMQKKLHCLHSQLLIVKYPNFLNL